MARLRIATFNVNGIRSRLPHLLQWLEREQPDIACLQELKAPDEGFPRAQIEAAGYGARWHGQRSWNGVAILARGAQPIESRRGLPGDPDDTHSRYLEAVAHGVVVGCLYLPNGNPQPGPKFDYKLRWFERLIAHARTLHASGHPVVLAGDFNVVPTDELDIYNPRSWRRDALLQPASRAAWQRLLQQGWTDALRTLHPDEKIFTFWDYFREHWPRNAGLRIDHLLLSPSLAPRLRAAGVDRWVRDLDGASDHAPTWIEMEMAGKSTGTPAAKKAAPVGKKSTMPAKITSAGGKKSTPAKEVVASGKKPAMPAKRTAAGGKKAAKVVRKARTGDKPSTVTKKTATTTTRRQEVAGTRARRATAQTPPVSAPAAGSRASPDRAVAKKATAKTSTRRPALGPAATRTAGKASKRSTGQVGKRAAPQTPGRATPRPPGRPKR